jgi:hypothetical protein
MLQITVDMFSGLPNPTWVAGPEEAQNLLQEMAKHRSAISAVHEGYQGLGYRGLIVESLTDSFTSKYDLPASFRIGNTGHPEGLEIAERILNSMRTAQALDGGLHGLVIQELQRLESRYEISAADPSVPAAAAGAAAVAAAQAVTCTVELAPFDPGFWNDPAHVQKNNCYNYGSNRRTDTFAQPGKATGHQATTMSCANVTAAALSDGLHRHLNCFPDSEKPRWLMALGSELINFSGLTIRS